MLTIPNQLEEADLGQDVELECQTEAYPDSINYWTTEDNTMIISGKTIYLAKTIDSRLRLCLIMMSFFKGYKYETFATKNGYNQRMKLKIRNIEQQDYRSYKCVAQNSLGTTDGEIKLDGKQSFLIINYNCSPIIKNH